MLTLRFKVEWLAGRYHGAEWPASPLRVYQAMVAGYSGARRGDPGLEAAMRHLETLAAPVIWAPRAEPLQTVKARGPDNDGDVVLALHAARKPTAARHEAEKLGSVRTRRPRRVEGAVTYDFEATGETASHLPAFATIARSVSAVGHGIDLAFARVALLERPPRAPGVRYTPSPDGRLDLNVPWPGGFGELEQRYWRERTRIGGGIVETGIEPVPARARYRSELDLPPVRSAAFELRSVDARRRIAFEGAHTMTVAAMVRHAIGCAARAGGLDAGVVSELMGHGGEGRILAQPLGNVGYRHADGRIRRVLLVAPECVGEDEWDTVVRRLVGAPLVEVGTGSEVGRLVPLGGQDSTLARYRGRGRTWTSATPVVLAGFDSRRGRPRPVRAVRRLLRHAGISESLLETVARESVGRLLGSGHALSYACPGHLKGYPVAHLTIGWTEPVAGPLSLGLGAGYGLGLFVPV